MAYTCLHLSTPCAVIGKSGTPLFNPAMQALLDSPLALELFLAQEQKARDRKSYFSVRNVADYGPEQIRQPYLFDFYPQFDCDCVDESPDDVEFECIGTICHARPFAFGSTQECVDREAPRPAMFEPDTRFTPNEREVIFNKIGAHSTRELAMYCRENGTDRYIPPSLLSLSSHVLSQGSVA